MKTPHKHAELIKAWAGGAEIEMRFYQAWTLLSNPRWDSAEAEYRIKPEPKHDVVKYGLAWGRVWDCKPMNGENLKLTFCGETGKLKSAEVIS